MERKTYGVGFPVRLVVVMAAFLTAIFMADATPSSAAASGKKKTTEMQKTAVEHTESRIKQLRTAIGVTEDQEVMWDKVTLVMRENAQDMDALTKSRSENVKTMNAVERIKLHSQMTEAQLAQQNKFIPAFEAFYDSLSDDQKAATDAIFRTGKHRKHKIQ